MDVVPGWRGGSADRLLDERHVVLAGMAVTLLEAMGWDVLAEVTFSEFGERGSIDLFAARASLRVVLVGEVKGEFASMEATLRSVDVKVRLAPKLCLDRFGFRPASVVRYLFLPENTTSRRRLSEHASLLDGSYPLRGRDARRWLAASEAVGAQVSPGGGIILLPEIAPGDRRYGRGGPHRVRRPTQ